MFGSSVSADQWVQVAPERAIGATTFEQFHQVVVAEARHLGLDLEKGISFRRPEHLVPFISGEDQLVSGHVPTIAIAGALGASGFVSPHQTKEPDENGASPEDQRNNRRSLLARGLKTVGVALSVVVLGKVTASSVAADSPCSCVKRRWCTGNVFQGCYRHYVIANESARGECRGYCYENSYLTGCNNC